MVVGSDQKFCIILSNNDTRTAALCLISLRHTKEIVLFHSHGIVDGYQRRHCLFSDGRNIGYCRYSGRTSVIGCSACFRYLCSGGSFCFCRCSSCYISKSCKTGAYIINTCHHTACYCAKQHSCCSNTCCLSCPAVFLSWCLNGFTVFISVTMFRSVILLFALLPLSFSLRGSSFRRTVWGSPVYIL